MFAYIDIIVEEFLRFSNFVSNKYIPKDLRYVTSSLFFSSPFSRLFPESARNFASSTIFGNPQATYSFASREFTRHRKSPGDLKVMVAEVCGYRSPVHPCGHWSPIRLLPRFLSRPSPLPPPPSRPTLPDLISTCSYPHPFVLHRIYLT